MTFTLREAVPSDAPVLTDIYLSAFTNDAISLLCFPRDSPAVNTWWTTMLAEEISDQYTHTLVITTSSSSPPSQETIIAFATWNAPSPTPRSTDLPAWPAGADVTLANYFFEQLIRRQIQIMGKERKHWYLELIATRPEWQGKGAAGKLIRWGLEKADEQGRECYLEASPDGRPIYERFGWRERERLAVDLGERDPCGTGEREFVEVMMVREAKAKVLVAIES